MLVEARSANLGDLLDAVNFARVQPGVSVVSMSWGQPEFSVGGSLQVLGSVSHVIVHLERFGRPVEVWEDTCPESKSREQVKDFVYLALIAAKEGRGRPHAR